MNEVSAEEQRLADPEVVDLLRHGAVDKQRKRRTRPRGYQRQFPLELELQELAVERQLHELVDRWNDAAETPQVRPYPDDDYVRKLEDLPVRLQQPAGKNALAQVTKLNHDNDAMDRVLPARLFVEFPDYLELGVQRNVGQPHHVVQGRAVRRSQVPGLHVRGDLLDDLEVVQAGVRHRLHTEVPESFQHLPLATQCLRNDRQCGTVIRDPASHDVQVVLERVQIHRDPIHCPTSSPGTST